MEQDASSLRARLRELEQAEREQRNMIEVLEHSGRQLRILLDSITDGFFTLDRKWRITFCNRTAAEGLRRLGVAEERLLGRIAWHVFPELVRSSFYKPFQKAMSEEVPVEFEEHYFSFDLWLEVRAYPFEEGLSVFFRDVTDRKKIAQALVESESRYRNLAESASDAILTIDEESRILFANRAAEAVFGYSQRELVGQSLLQLMPEDLRIRHREGLREYLGTGLKHIQWERVEFSGLHKSGRIMPLEISISEYIQEGRFCFTGIVRDVSARKVQEETLRESHERFRLLFKRSPIPMWVCDRETLEFLEVNLAACAGYGYAQEELLRMRLGDLHPRGELPKLKEILAGLLAEDDRLIQARHRLKSGEMIDVEITLHALDFAGRKAVLGLAQNITGKLHEEKAIRESEQAYRLLFEANPEPMWVFEAESFRFLAVNNAATEKYGYSREEFLSMTIRDIRPEEDVEKLTQAVLSEHHGVVSSLGLWRHRKKDGSLIWVDITAEPIEFAGKKAKLVVAREVAYPEGREVPPGRIFLERHGA